MILSISLVLAFFHIFRGWLKQILTLSIAASIGYYLIVNFMNNAALYTFVLEVSIFFIMVIMLFLPKKNNQPKCPKCKESVCSKQFSCPTCGTPLQKDTFIEEFKNNTHYIKKVLPHKDLFFEARDAIMQQYHNLGYSIKAVDKHNMLMLKHNDMHDSHVIVKRINYNLIIEAYNVEKPEFDLQSI